MVHIFDRAELLYQLGRCLFAYSLDARNVVRRIAPQGLVIGHVLRAKTEALRYPFLIVEHGVGKPFAERVHFYPVTDKLERIEIAGGDDRLYIAARRNLRYDGAHTVVRFKARRFIERNTKRFKYFRRSLELRD